MSSVIKLLHGGLPMAGLLAWPLSNSKNPLISNNQYCSSSMGPTEACTILFHFATCLQVIKEPPPSLQLSVCVIVIDSAVWPTTLGTCLQNTMKTRLWENLNLQGNWVKRQNQSDNYFVTVLLSPCKKTKGIELIKVLPFFPTPWEDQTQKFSQLLLLLP